jgi:hypothetical protein
LSAASRCLGIMAVKKHSAVDIFGGSGVRCEDVLKLNRRQIKNPAAAQIRIRSD